MFQLGLTPASDQENLSGGVGGLRNHNHRGRYSNASLRDSRRSGRSSDLGGGSRPFEDILEDLQTQQGNLLDGLPIVGDDRENIIGGSGGGGTGGISQFKLVEESGPSMPQTQLTGPMEQHSKTFQVLASLRSLTSSLELSLTQATYGLNRMEAAQVFSHVLVGSSKGFINVNQEEPYGDITLTFFN
jgi:Conserved region of Rad21 / Rec8 like protein